MKGLEVQGAASVSPGPHAGTQVSEQLRVATLSHIDALGLYQEARRSPMETQ